MRIKQMPRDKLILNDELRHEVAVPHIQRIFAVMSRHTISELDVNEVWYSRSVAKTLTAIIEPIHVNVVRESGEANVAISQRWH